MTTLSTLSPLTTLTDDELADGICTWAGRVAAGEAELLRWIAEFDRREAWAGPGLLSCAHWLSWRIGLSPGAARERVRIARALTELPDAAGLATDPRCRLVLGDFFALVASGQGFGGPVHAILLDVDHTPRHVLHPSHASFYEPAGLRRLLAQLHPGGVFALWSDDPPDEEFLVVLRDVFAQAEAHVVPFANHLTGGTSSNTVYVATAA